MEQRTVRDTAALTDPGDGRVVVSKFLEAVQRGPQHAVAGIHANRVILRILLSFGIERVNPGVKLRQSLSAHFGRNTMASSAIQAISHPLASLHARSEATRLFVYRTAAAFDIDQNGSDVAGEANMAKLLTADLVFDAADHAVQVLGADAWDERTGWLDVYLDARLSRSGPVSNEFALNFVAEHVLGLPLHA
jgi:hypothetical protein